MGMERTIRFSGVVPTWAAIRDRLARAGFPVQVKMIDGQLAFPDEEPTEEWRELRLGTSGGMVTLRREVDSILCVTWGNADTPLLRAWNAVAWGCATAGDGCIDGQSPTEFLVTVPLPETMKPSAG
jgi:hypothetical protein